MSQRSSTVETIVAAAGAGAMLYFCFTQPGKAQLRRLETWLEEGTSETSRLVDILERVALVASTVGGVVGLVTKANNDSRHEGSSAAIDNLINLPSALRASPRTATVS
jgi:hypothetical protein